MLLDQTYELVSVDDLSAHPENPRRGDAPGIAASVEANGFYGALVAQRSTGHVLAGNHRLMAAREAGVLEVPVVWLEVDDERARRILLVDNRAADRAGYDQEALAAMLGGLADTDEGLAGTGYSADDLAALLAGSRPPESLTDPDDAPEIPRARPVSSLGDVWLLGAHRLICGDASDMTAIETVTNGDKVDVLFTDPPYGVAYVGKTSQKLRITNDDLAGDQLLELLLGSFSCAHEVLRPGGAFYICSPSGLLETTFRAALAGVGLELRQQIVWVKDQFVLGRADYHGQHETILYGWADGVDPGVPPHYDPEHGTVLYGWKSGAAHTFEGGRKQTTVWAHDRPRRSSVHPTMKPVELVRRAILNSSRSGALVLDPFAGSGTTLIACHLTGRVGAAVELDPRYVDVIARRFQEHTGVVPVLEATGAAHDFTRPA